MIVSITGHRPDKLGGWKQPNPIQQYIKSALKERLAELAPTYVITGMAQGVDQWAAEACIELQIPFIAAVPFAGQESVWPMHAQEKYHWILKRSHAAYVICEGAYEPKKMFERNKWMVNEANIVLAVWDGSPGGTSTCVNYAYSVGKPVEKIDLSPIKELLQQLSDLNPGQYKVVEPFMNFMKAKSFSSPDPSGASISKMVKKEKVPLGGFLDSIKSEADKNLENLKAAQKVLAAEKIDNQTKVTLLSELESSHVKNLELQKEIEKLKGINKILTKQKFNPSAVKMEMAAKEKEEEKPIDFGFNRKMDID